MRWLVKVKILVFIEDSGYQVLVKRSHAAELTTKLLFPT